MSSIGTVGHLPRRSPAAKKSRGRRRRRDDGSVGAREVAEEREGQGGMAAPEKTAGRCRRRRRGRLPVVCWIGPEKFRSSRFYTA